MYTQRHLIFPFLVFSGSFSLKPVYLFQSLSKVTPGSRLRERAKRVCFLSLGSVGKNAISSVPSISYLREDKVRFVSKSAAGKLEYTGLFWFNFFFLEKKCSVSSLARKKNIYIWDVFYQMLIFICKCTVR